MKAQFVTRGLALAMAGQMLATSAFATYGSIYIPRNTVVPVVFEDELNIKRNREGDRFFARVEDDRDLPRGSRVEGRIIDIVPARDKRPAYMDLEFTTVILPDGSREYIRAVPISLDSKAINRGRDGRMQADPQKIKSEHMVLGGLIGGLIIGGLLRKPFEGAFVGTLAGVILGEAQRKSGGGDVIVRKGARYGAMFEQDAEIRYDGYGYDDRDRDRDRDRDDEWYRDQDRNRDRDDDTYRRRDDDWRRERDQYGYNDARITYENRELRFDNDARPYRTDNGYMVPLEKAAGQLGLTVDKVNGQVIYVEDDDTSLRLELDSRDYRLNGKRGTLRESVMERNGIVYVPLNILAAAKDRPVYLNGTRVEQIS